MKRLMLSAIAVVALSGCVAQGAMKELHKRCVDRQERIIAEEAEYASTARASAEYYCLCAAETYGGPKAWYLLASDMKDLTNGELADLHRLATEMEENGYCRR